jgi:beta-galactosidase
MVFNFSAQLSAALRAKKIISILTMFLCFALSSHAQDKHIFSLSKQDFLLDGKPFQIISGEMHPARIPRAYWQQRIRMAKAMGCNTIAAYIFWNYHESAPGAFDFTTGNHDIAAFIRLCKQEGMWVLLRPGPYVCAEWDFGGLPPYLLKIPDIKVRCMDSRYMAAATRYINRLAKEVTPLQCTNGGPILMVQVENEYGSYGNDKTYIKTLRDLWVKDGITVPFYTSDGATDYMLDAGNVDGAAIGLDSGGNDDDFATAKRHNPNVPAFSGETYPGWLTHWKEAWQRTDTSVLPEVRYLLQHKRSFNLYVVHGGTNFGFTAGANAFTATQYQPDVTSYDYDAPITEQGQPTPKYFALRKLISEYVSYKIPDVPAAIPAITVPSLTMQPFTSVWQQLPAPVQSPQPKPMEALGQQSGFILYRTKLIGHKSGKLTITEPHDFALVFLNGVLVDSVYRDGGNWTVNLPKSNVKDPQLDILVEAMGHINFAQFMIDRKGITDRVTLNGMTLMDWQIYNLPMDDKFINTLKKSVTAETLHDGVFFKGSFALDSAADTYLDVSNFKKGVIWVNGHNLGRYWNAGPQKRLYCPAGWLKKGENEVVVFDLHLATAATIKGEKALE